MKTKIKPDTQICSECDEALDDKTILTLKLQRHMVKEILKAIEEQRQYWMDAHDYYMQTNGWFFQKVPEAQEKEKYYREIFEAVDKQYH